MSNKGGQANKAMIYIKVVAGQDIRTKSSPGNTFCYLKVGKSRKVKTEIVQRTSSDISWTEKGRLFNMDEETATVQVIDYVTFFPDDFIGQVKLKFSDFADGVPRDEWFPLHSKSGKRETGGQLRLQIMETHPQKDTSISDSDFACKLHTLLKKGKTQAFNTLVAKTKEINVQDPQGKTALHVACELDIPDAVSSLLQFGADPGLMTADGMNAFHVAASHSAKCLSILLTEQASPSFIDASGGIIRSRSAMETDESGLTPLHTAALNDQAGSARLLIERGCQVNRATAKGNTALHLALRSGADEVVRVLITWGKARMHDENVEGVSPARLAIAIGGKVKAALKESANVEDDREFDILKAGYQTRIRIQGDHVEYDWKKSQQICISSKEKTHAVIIIHFLGGGLIAQEKDSYANKFGFVVVRTKDGVHQELSYQTETVGYGGLKPFDALLDPEWKYAIIPYSQESVLKGKYALLVFTKDQPDLNPTALLSWTFKSSVEGEWKGVTAAGCANNREWRRNPIFLLDLPKEKKPVEVNILLSQKRVEMDLIPYQVIPYPYYIGFYIYDAGFTTKLGECERWKNAQETYQRFIFDTQMHGQVLIVPTTFDDHQETLFTLSVHCDSPVSLSSFAPPSWESFEAGWTEKKGKKGKERKEKVKKKAKK